jgi:hypothetical protein
MTTRKPMPDKKDVKIKKQKMLPHVIVTLGDLKGPNGNAFAILGQCRSAMERAGISQDLQKQFEAEATSGDYEHLLKTVKRWFAVYQAITHFEEVEEDDDE